MIQAAHDNTNSDKQNDSEYGKLSHHGFYGHTIINIYTKHKSDLDRNRNICTRTDLLNLTHTHTPKKNVLAWRRRWGIWRKKLRGRKEGEKEDCLWRFSFWLVKLFEASLVRKGFAVRWKRKKSEKNKNLLC